MILGKGWYRPENKKSHYFVWRESTAMATYGESYGGGSSPTTCAARSLCKREILYGYFGSPSVSLSKKRPMNACKTCKKLIKESP